MLRKTAAIAGSSVLVIAALGSRANAQTRYPVSGSFVPPANAAYAGYAPYTYGAYGPYGAWSYGAYAQSVGAAQWPATNATATRDRAESARPPRPSRTTEHVYIDGGGGITTVWISSLVQRDLQPASESTSASGPTYGVGGGVRFGFFTLGGRVQGSHLNVGQLTTIDGEIGARITIDRVEPRFTLGVGYAHLSAMPDAVARIADLDIHGYNARAGFGVDYYADKNVSIGVNFTGDVLVMARPGVDLSTSPEAQAEARVKTCDPIMDPAQKQQCVLAIVHDAEGTSAGFAGTASVVVGVHF